jgi:hypothetical protein
MHPSTPDRRVPQLPWPDFLRCLGASRVALFPNTWDPSPRMMAEAMSLDLPLLVNSDILGGWKYVCDAAGKFQQRGGRGGGHDIG